MVGTGMNSIFSTFAHLNLKLSTKLKKQTQNTAKPNYPGSVAFYDTRPGNKLGNASEPTRGICNS